MVNQYKEALEKQEAGGNIVEKLKELEKKHVMDKTRTNEEFEEFKRKTQQRENEINMMHQDKVENMKMDLSELKGRFDDQLTDLKQQMKDSQTNNAEVDALKKKLAEHVRESNKKYNDLLQSKLDLEDELKAKSEKEKKRMLADFDIRVKEEVEKTIAEEDKKRAKALASQAADYQIKLDDLSRRLQDKDDKHKSETDSLKEEISSLTNQLQSRDSQIESLENQVKALQIELKNLRELGASSSAANQDLLDQLNHSNEVIRQKEAEIERLNLKIEQMSGDFSRREGELTDEIANLRSQASGDKASLTDQIEDMSSQIRKLQMEVDRLEKELADERKKFGLLEMDKLGIEQKLQTRIGELEQQISRLQANSSDELVQLQKQLTDLREQMEKEITELKQTHAGEISEINENHSTLMRDTQDKYERELKEGEETHAQKV